MQVDKNRREKTLEIGDLIKEHLQNNRAMDGTYKDSSKEDGTFVYPKEDWCKCVQGESPPFLMSPKFRTVKH